MRVVSIRKPLRGATSQTLTLKQVRRNRFSCHDFGTPDALSIASDPPRERGTGSRRWPGTVSPRPTQAGSPISGSDVCEGWLRLPWPSSSASRLRFAAAPHSPIPPPTPSPSIPPRPPAPPRVACLFSIFRHPRLVLSSIRLRDRPTRDSSCVPSCSPLFAWR